MLEAGDPFFGQDYEANYAPLVGADDKLTGALFAAVPK
jgi:hypothetical protein